MDGRDLDGEAAREDAREDATIALASESTILMEWVELDVRRWFLFWRAARQDGL